MYLVLCSQTILVRHELRTVTAAQTLLFKQGFFFMFLYRSETFKVHYLMFLLVLLKALDVLLNAVSYWQMNLNFFCVVSKLLYFSILQDQLLLHWARWNQS